MPEINKPTILRHIAASDLTAVEKRYLEGLVEQAEPVPHGRWSHDCEGYVRCSVCNEHEPNGFAIFYAYCPSCGAKMDGGADDVD